MIPASDESAFVDMLNEHRGAIQRIARLYADRAEDRADLVQEIVYQLWRAYPSFRRESSALTWLYRVALNTAITTVRRRARHPEHAALEADREVAALPAAEAPPPSEIELLYAAIARLTDVERALIMCYLDDLSYKRIGEVLGLSETAVGARLTRTKARLQRIVRELEPGTGAAASGRERRP